LLIQSKALKKAARFTLKRIVDAKWFREQLSDATRRGVIPESIWKWVPVDITFSVLLPDGSSFFYVGSSGDHIARRLFWGGLTHFDPMWKLFYRIARQSEVILDIGANTGVYTLIACAANPKCKVIALEPVPRVFDRLQKNVAMNNLEDRVEARKEAVSNFVGSAQLAVPDEDCPVMSSLDLDDYVRMYQLKHLGLIDVPVTTIDNICDRTPTVNLVKIDVQGSEHLVIQGMQEVLTRAKPALIVDYHQSCPRGAIESVLAEFGYLYFRVQEGRLTRNSGMEDVGCYLAITADGFTRLEDRPPPTL
jgi:FkbM family methyltransferase